MDVEEEEREGRKGGGQSASSFRVDFCSFFRKVLFQCKAL